MITEEQIKKAAGKILGEENKDWFFEVEKEHERWIRRVWVQCKHCNSCLHILFDFRESMDNAGRKDPEMTRRLKRLKIPQ